jgi:hypothetical protein
MPDTDPGVINQHIQTPCYIIQFRKSPVDSSLIGHVRLEAARQSGQLVLDALQAELIPIQDEQPRTFFNETLHGRSPDPAGPAGNYHAFILEISHNGLLASAGAIYIHNYTRFFRPSPSPNPHIYPLPRQILKNHRGG